MEWISSKVFTIPEGKVCLRECRGSAPNRSKAPQLLEVTHLSLFIRLHLDLDTRIPLGSNSLYLKHFRLVTVLTEVTLRDIALWKDECSCFLGVYLDKKQRPDAGASKKGQEEKEEKFQIMYKINFLTSYFLTCLGPKMLKS